MDGGALLAEIDDSLYPDDAAWALGQAWFSRVA
jgi:hypothetical protein